MTKPETVADVLAEWLRDWPLTIRFSDLLERIQAAHDREVSDFRQIAHLIGSIFYYGDFKAETYNERTLETLLRKTGNFYESAEAALRSEK